MKNPGDVITHHILDYQYVIAAVLSSRSRDRIIDLSMSDVMAIKLLGHIGNIHWRYWCDNGFNEARCEEYKSSLEFVTNRLTRKINDKSDLELLASEIKILESGGIYFARPLTGEIAVPLAELFY